jgi:hypothetical protein
MVTRHILRDVFFVDTPKVTKVQDGHHQHKLIYGSLVHGVRWRWLLLVD